MYIIIFCVLKYKYKKCLCNKDWGELRVYIGNSMYFCKIIVNFWDFFLNFVSVFVCVVILFV